MTRDEILSKVREVLSQTFEIPAASISEDAHLYQDLDLDSFDAVDLAVTLNSETGIKLKEEEMKAIRTVGDIVDVVEKDLTAKSST